MTELNKLKVLNKPDKLKKPLITGRVLWLEKSGDPEKIEELVRSAGNLRYQFTRALNAGVGEIEDLVKIGDPGKTGDLRKTGGLAGIGDPGKREGDSLLMINSQFNRYRH